MSVKKTSQPVVPSKKVAAKKAPSPTTKTTSKSEEPKQGNFVAKKIGANLIVTVVGTTEKYSRKVSQDESNVVMNKMKIYNKRPSGVKKQEIIDLLTPGSAKKKKEVEKTTAKVKGLKQQVKKIKKATKKTGKEDANLIAEIENIVSSGDEAEISKIQAVLDKFKKKEEIAPAPVVAPVQRRGEY